MRSARQLISGLMLISTLNFGQSVSSPEVLSFQFDSTEISLSKPMNRLVKAGLLLPIFKQSSVSGATIWKTLGVDLTIEQALGAGLTLVGGLETSYNFSRYAQLFSLDLPLSLRYYYPVGNQKKNRVAQYRFFYPYIGLQTQNSLFSSLFYDNVSVERYYRGRFLDHVVHRGKYDEAFNMMQYVYFQVGCQFRLGKSNYLDIIIGLPINKLIYNKTELTLATPSIFTAKYGIFK